MNKGVMRLLLILLCYFLLRTYGSASSTCPSGRVKVQGRKQFNVIPGSPPVHLGCKQVIKGTVYVISSDPPTIRVSYPIYNRYYFKPLSD